MLRGAFIVPAVFLSLFILSGCNLFQERTGGGETAYDLDQTDDGGYILAGARDLDNVRTVALLTRTDARGNEEWSQIFEISGDDMKAYAVRQTGDGGYVFTGIFEPHRLNRNNAFLIKTDGEGNEEWSQTFGGSDNDYAYSVQQTGDGGYILTGYTWSYGAGRYDAWLIKTDDRGEEEWSQTFGGSRYDIKAHFVQQTRDGGYILAGCTETAGLYTPAPWLLKTDAAGNEEWSLTFDKSSLGFANSVQQTGDGGYIVILSGYPYHTYDADLWLIKIDALGNEEWAHLFEGNNRDYARSVQQTRDGGYILAGGSGNTWLLKTDDRGNEEWLQVFMEDGRNFAYSALQSQDGGFVLAGYTRPESDSTRKALLIKTGARGDKEWSQTFGDEYIVGHSATPGLIFFVALPLALLVFNLAYFLVFSGDVKRRNEKYPAWLFMFLILGPLAATWYTACRKPKEGEAVGGKKIHHLAKYFLLHWTVFLWLFPAFLLLMASIVVGPGYVFIGILAVLLGTGFLFFLIWFALWLVPLIFAVIIMLATIPPKDSQSL